MQLQLHAPASIRFHFRFYFPVILRRQESGSFGGRNCGCSVDFRKADLRRVRTRHVLRPQIKFAQREITAVEKTPVWQTKPRPDCSNCFAGFPSPTFARQSMTFFNGWRRRRNGTRFWRAAPVSRPWNGCRRSCLARYWLDDNSQTPSPQFLD